MISLNPCLLDPTRARVLDIPKNNHSHLHDLKPHTSLSSSVDIEDAGGQFVATLRRSGLPALFLIKPIYVVFS